MANGTLTDHDRIVEMHTDMKYLKKAVVTNTTDINKLKSWKDKVNGALAIISLVVGVAWTKILDWF